MKKYFKYQFLNQFFNLSYTAFQITIVWGIYQKNNNLKNVVAILVSMTIFRAIFALFSGFLIDHRSSQRMIQLASLFMITVGLLNIFSGANLLIAILSTLLMQIGQEIFRKSYTSFISSEMKSREFIKFDGTGQMISGLVAIFGSLLISSSIAFLSVKITLALTILLLLCVLIFAQLFFKENQSLSIEEANDNFDFTGFKEAFKKRYILEFIAILFVLNLNYGYIPNVLPFFLTKQAAISSPFLIGFIQSATNFGGILATFFIVKFGNQVSQITKIGIIGSIFVFALLPFALKNPIFTVILFIIYGCFDSLTQPFFSYFVSKIPKNEKGKILGIVDCTVFLASPIGMIIGNFLSKISFTAVAIYLIIVFIFAFFLMNWSKNYRKITE